MWDVTPVHEHTHEQWKEGHYSVWAESAILVWWSWLAQRKSSASCFVAWTQHCCKQRRREVVMECHPTFRPKTTFLDGTCRQDNWQEVILKNTALLYPLPPLHGWPILGWQRTNCSQDCILKRFLCSMNICRYVSVPAGDKTSRDEESSVWLSLPKKSCQRDDKNLSWPKMKPDSWQQSRW